MALVPRQETEIVLYTQGLSRSERRRIENSVREVDLNEALHARHHRLRMRNANQLMKDASGYDSAYDAEIQATLDANESPRLEDATDKRWATWQKISARIVESAYGDG